MRCSICLQLTTYTDGNAYCSVCGARLTLSSPIYSGREPEDIITGNNGSRLRHSARSADARHFPRIPCRNVKACIQTEEAASFVVDVVNLSRGGLCFLSIDQFAPGTPASVAVHYVKGGQNIFQKGRVVWTHERKLDLPSQCGVEFSLG
jgi:hypothetical protein